MGGILLSIALTPFLQIGKLRPRSGKGLMQGQSLPCNAGSAAAQPCVLSVTVCCPSPAQQIQPPQWTKEPKGRESSHGTRTLFLTEQRCFTTHRVSRCPRIPSFTNHFFPMCASEWTFLKRSLFLQFISSGWNFR